MKFLPLSDSGWIEGRGYRKQVLLKEHDLQAECTLVQIIEIEPHTSTPLHYHKSSLEVFHILSGTGIMSISGNDHTMRPGDTITCVPPEVHATHNRSDEVFRYIVFKTNVVPDDSYWLDEESP